MSATFDYSKKSFTEIKQTLLNYIQDYYPDVYNDFSQDSSIDNVLLELNAAVANQLYYALDRNTNEVFLDTAQQRKTLLELALNYGLKIPNKKASISVCEFSCNVPTLGDTYNSEYLPIIKSDTTLAGNGQFFQPVNDIDFSSPYSSLGTPNRVIIPNIDNENNVRSYTITKREVVSNAQTKSYFQFLTKDNVKPFMEIVLPDTNVLDITSIIVKPGLVTTEPSLNDYSNDEYLFNEVDYLLEPYIFTENNNYNVNNTDYLKSGIWKRVTKKFIKNYTDKGYCKLIFGGGNGDLASLNNSLTNLSEFANITNYLNNTALGEIPKLNSTIYIKYKVGGGSQSNVGVNQINSYTLKNVFVNGTEEIVNQAVKNSLKVTNIIPAFGGRDSLSTEELRNYIKYNTSEKGVCVTNRDFISRIMQMPGKYGAPFKFTVYTENNKRIVAILGLDENNNLSNTSTLILKNNIAEYLSQHILTNDYIEVQDCKIYNLGYDFDVLVDNKVTNSEIMVAINKVVTDYHDIYKNNINQDIFLGSLIEKINNISGILNINAFKVYNKVGGNYSTNEIEQTYLNLVTREIDINQNILFSSKNSMFEIKYPLKDIRVKLIRKNGNI